VASALPVALLACWARMQLRRCSVHGQRGHEAAEISSRLHCAKTYAGALRCMLMQVDTLISYLTKCAPQSQEERSPLLVLLCYFACVSCGTCAQTRCCSTMVAAALLLSQARHGTPAATSCSPAAWTQPSRWDSVANSLTVRTAGTLHSSLHVSCNHLNCCKSTALPHACR
jgi:hypothetical protein